MTIRALTSRAAARALLTAGALLIVAGVSGTQRISPATAAISPSATSSLTLELVPTYESIGISLGFSGDDNWNNEAVLAYRPAGTSRWLKGMDMSPDRRTIVAGNPNLFVNQWRASILGVSANTDYEIKVSVSDPDGTTGSPVVGSVRTWKETDTIPANGRSIYVALNGDDTAGDGSQTNPYGSIQWAADQAIGGDTVYVGGGTYILSAGIGASSSGAEDSYITIRNAAGEAVTLDVAAVTGCGNRGRTPCAFDVTGSYVRISGFTVDNLVSGKAIIVREPAHHVIVEDNVLNISGFGQPNGVFIGHMDFGTQSQVSHVTVQRNQIYLTESGTGTTGSESTGPGILAQNAAGQLVIRDNLVQYFGSTAVHGRDCFGGLPNTKIRGGYSDSDIYDNVCLNATDDGISLDGGAKNVRVWGNRLTGSMVGVSIAPILVGPVYIFRNVVEDLQEHWGKTCIFFKLGEDGSGDVYVIHNTFYAADRFLSSAGKECKRIDGLGNSANGVTPNVRSFNNIWEFDGRAISDSGDKPIVDYNLYYDWNTEASGYFARWDNTAYDTLADFQAGTGQGANGAYGQATFVDRINDDYQLAAGSLGIDAAKLIFGFNDPDSAWPFAGLGPDVGAFEVPDLDPNAPPFRLNPTPVGELQPGTTQAMLGLLTSKVATCKYSQTPNVSYASMPNTFQSTGAPEHSTLVGGLEDGQTYNFYVRCNAAAPNLDDLLISFSVRAIDTTPPVPTNVQTSWVNNALFVSWDTDDSSTVSVAYGLSPTTLDQSVSDSVLRVNHSVMVAGLQGSTLYYYQLAMCNVDGACGSSAVKGVTTGVFDQQLMISALTTVSGEVYEVSDGGLLTGAGLYIDRGYSFSSIPSSLAGMTYIKTANGDKSRTDPVVVTFLVNQDVTVYVAYDARATSLPNWLAGWSSIGVTLVTTDTDRALYGKELAAGQISLGGNIAAGAFGAESNYNIIVSSSTGGLPVTFPTLPGMSAPARDLDGDGTAEDVNGNGLLDFADVVAMFQNLDSPEVTGNITLFDFNNNGMIDMDDVVALFEQTIGA